MLTDLNVSRETLEKLNTFNFLLNKWNPKINLISKSDVKDVWERHVLDSRQIYTHFDDSPNCLDIGSGGGFPGIVISIMAQELHPKRHVTMVESDGRKSTFLRTVVRELGLSATVIVDRIENIAPLRSDILTARALAELNQLIYYADMHLKSDGKAYFFKGEKWEKEVEKARKSWNFDLTVHKSMTSANSAILELKDIRLA